MQKTQRINKIKQEVDEREQNNDKDLKRFKMYLGSLDCTRIK